MRILAIPILTLSGGIREYATVWALLSTANYRKLRITADKKCSSISLFVKQIWEQRDP